MDTDLTDTQPSTETVDSGYCGHGRCIQLDAEAEEDRDLASA